MSLVKEKPSQRLPALLSSRLGRRKREAGLNAPAPQVGGEEVRFGVPHGVVPSLQVQSPGLPAGTLPYWDWNGMHGRPPVDGSFHSAVVGHAELDATSMSSGDSYRGTGSGAM